MLRFSLLFLLIIAGNGVKSFVRDRLSQPEQVDESMKILEEEDKRNLPAYIQRLGKLGVNFDLDINATEQENLNKPFIYCETYDYNKCKEGPTNCTTVKKCYPGASTHQLGCMAVLVYNTLENGTIQEEPNIKECWSHEKSEHQECKSETECVVLTRMTGILGRNAKFCCCRTHLCNGKFTYRPDEPISEDEEETDDDEHSGVKIVSEHSNHWFLGALVATFVLFLLISVFIACFVLTQALRRKFAKKGIKQIQPVNRAREDPLLSEVTLNDGSRVKLTEIQLLEKVSDGRFGQVYKARVGENYFAVKLFPEEAEDSWTNEMDLYNLKPLCKNDSIAKFLGGFQWDKKCWLLIQFYEKASLYDFLKSNTVNLLECTRMISTMLDGLAFLHEEIPTGPDEKPAIVHRDLKSKNILVKDDLSTCITDFGLALRCDSKGISADQNHLQVGTRRYMSPEVLEGATEFTSFAFQQIDVYAAALVIWEVLSRTRIPEAKEEELNPFLLPYEKEVGTNPSVNQVRDLVALQKCRPQVRPTLQQNEVSASITRTMREMWDPEPDGRITSSCARDRSRFWISEAIT